MKYRRLCDLSLEEIGRIRARYRADAEVRPLAAEHGLPPTYVYRLLHGLGEKLRTEDAKEERATRMVSTLDAGVFTAEGGLDVRAAARVLERQAVRQLLVLQERAAAAPAGPKSEALFRAVAGQARTLKSVRDWATALTHEDEPDDEAPPPRTLGELRDELCRHLERIAAEPGGGPDLRGGAEPA